MLEFGIGTPRLALRLQELGVRVAGIDASPRMVAALRSKPGGAELDVEIGDYTSARVRGSFSVVALVFNNILDERGVDAQLAIFQNAVWHLEPDGCFVVEAFVFDEAARNGAWTVVPRCVGEDHVEFQLSRFDIDTSCVRRTLVHLRPNGAEFVSVKDSYAAPGQLDVRAHVNGLKRTARYSDWKRAPFSATSQRHITLYELR